VNRIPGTEVVALSDVLPKELAAVSAKSDIPQILQWHMLPTLSCPSVNPFLKHDTSTVS